MTWGPLDKTLNRYDIALDDQLRGRGLSTQINQITENLARSLGAKKLVLSAIVNDRWREHLLKNGFRRDPMVPSRLFKNL